MGMFGLDGFVRFRADEVSFILGGEEGVGLRWVREICQFGSDVGGLWCGVVLCCEVVVRM